MFQADIKDDINNKKAIRFADLSGRGLDFNLLSFGYYDQAKQEYRVIEFASNSKVRVEDNKATYKDAFEGVDVVYTYQNDRLKEDIYLTEQLRKELPNTKKFGFDHATTYLMVQSEIELDEGLNVSFASMDSGSFYIETHKRIDFVDHLGERLFYWPTDLAYVEGLPDDLEVEFEIPVLKRLYKQDEQIYLLAGIPVNWLNKIEKGVIVMDPTMVIQNPSQIQDAYVYKWLDDPNKANNNYGSSTVILWAAGTNNSKDTFYRSFIQFDFSVIPSNSRLTGAELYLTNDGYPHSGGNYSRYSIAHGYIRRVTQKWDETTVTWNNQPEDTTAHQVSVPAPTEPDQSLEADVTQLVRDILGSFEGNHGFLLRLQNETKYRGVRYASSNHADSNRWPKLTIEYELLNKAFYLKDHLGNICVTVADDGTVISTDDYYPFGLQMPGRSYNVGFDRNIYKYSSKELDDEQFSGGGLDWYYFGARYYDPEIGRWMCPDPLADKHPDYTPYAYVYNQPTNLIDPFGLDSSATSSFFSSLFQGFANAFYSKPKEAENSNNGSENSKNDGSPPTEEQVAEQVGSEIGNNLGEFATNEFYIAISGGKEMSIIPAQGSIIFTKNNGVIKIGGLNVTKALDLIKAIKGGIPISVSFGIINNTDGTKVNRNDIINQSQGSNFGFGVGIEHAESPDKKTVSNGIVFSPSVWAGYNWSIIGW